MKSPLKTNLSQLTARELALVRAHVKGLSGLAAAADAGVSYKNPATASAAISRAMAHPAAQGYAAELRRRAGDLAEDDTVLTILEKRRFLARVIRVPLVKIDPDKSDDPNADLVKKLKRRFYVEDEQEKCSEEFEKLDPLKAISLDNELAGHKKPQEHKISPDDLLGSILSDLATHAGTRERL